MPDSETSRTSSLLNLTPPTHKLILSTNSVVTSCHIDHFILLLSRSLPNTKTKQNQKLVSIKMGLFGKKNEIDSEDSNRLALFGNRSKSKSPAPSTNPYAQPQAGGNPYAQSPASAPSNPYAEAKARAYANPALPPSKSAGGNPYGDKRPGGYGDNKSGVSDGYEKSDDSGNQYGASSGGYGAHKYGNQAGYGGDRYGTSKTPAAQGSTSRYGAGGYGGLGGDSFTSQQDDEARNALFGGASERLQQRQQERGGYGAPPPPYEDGAQSEGHGGPSQDYTPYQDRQLTAEEEEEEDVKATKQQIRFLKQEDVSRTRNALRIAEQAEEVGRDTLARLGTQGEHIHNAEKHLDLAHNQNRIAEEKAREIKTLNRSMFAVHVSNPFTSASREKARDQDVIDRHIEEREQREATRRAAYQSDQRMQKTFKDLSSPTKAGEKQKNIAERAKYQFEADSDDEEMENEIDSNLDALGGVTARLNALARATGKEVDEQNKHLDVISQKVCYTLIHHVCC